MNVRQLILILGLLSTSTLLAADGVNLEFLGVMGSVQKTSVQLVNTANGVSAWVPVGQTFGGYAISSYDPKSDTLTVTKDGIPSRLHLKSSKLQKATGLTPEERAQQQKAVLNNLRQIGAAADQFFLENGKTSVTIAELVGPDKYIKELKAVDGEDYSRLELKPGKDLVVTTASGVTVSYKQ
jgi:hypothetical protein